MAYFAVNKPVKGKLEHASNYNGVTYHFVSADAKQAFDANPKKYIPAYGGWCAFGMSVEAKFPSIPRSSKSSTGSSSSSSTSGASTLASSGTTETRRSFSAKLTHTGRRCKAEFYHATSASTLPEESRSNGAHSVAACPCCSRRVKEIRLPNPIRHGK